MRSWLAPLADPATTACVAAERAFARVLGGSCEVPIAAYAVLEGGELWLRGRVAEPDGSRIYGGEIRGSLAEAGRLGETLAQRLLDEGAAALVAALSGGAA